MQAGAVMQQIALSEVAAHAVAEQDDRHAGMLLADVLIEAGQITDDFAPTVVVGEMPERTVFGSFAMSTQVRGIHAVAFSQNVSARSGVATAVFRHAMGQQDHRFERAGRQPLIDEQAAAVTRGQP